MSLALDLIEFVGGQNRWQAWPLPCARADVRRYQPEQSESRAAALAQLEKQPANEAANPPSLPPSSPHPSLHPSALAVFFFLLLCFLSKLANAAARGKRTWEGRKTNRPGAAHHLLASAALAAALTCEGERQSSQLERSKNRSLWRLRLLQTVEAR